MAKMVRINDDIYNEITVRAAAGPIGKVSATLMTNYLLGMALNNYEALTSMQKTETVFFDTARDKGTILAEIRAAEQQRDEELAACQDEETANRIRRDADSSIAKLWSEYHG